MKKAAPPLILVAVMLLAVAVIAQVQQSAKNLASGLSGRRFG